MPRNVIPNGYAFAYRGRTAEQSLDLHKWCVSVSDNLLNRIAKHAYLKRDGAEKEPMGASDGAFRFRLNIVGNDCAAQYRTIAQYCRANPRGTLTHPALGDIKAACEGIDEASIDIVAASNCINVSLKFSEDAVDTSIAQADAVAPATASGQVTRSAGSVRLLIGQIAALGTLAEKAATAAETFQSSAMTAWQTGAPDPRLAVLIGDVRDAAGALESAIKADSSYRNEAERFAPIQAARLLLASALGLDEAVRRLRPAIVPFTISQTMPLSTIALVLYGKDASAKCDELRLLNRIPNPFAVPGGTVLQVSQTTA